MTLDTHWLTYAELADRLGITGESARNLVRRRQWPRKPGNDGVQRIGVPAEYLDERAISSDEAAIVATITPPIEPPVEGDMEAPIMAATVAALEAHIVTLKGVVDHERHRADRERDRADALVSDVAQLRERAEQERAKGQALAAELAQVRERAEAEASRARALMSETVEARSESQHKVASVEKDVAALRAMVEAMRAAPAPAQPWWSRLAHLARDGRS